VTVRVANAAFVRSALLNAAAAGRHVVTLVLSSMRLFVGVCVVCSCSAVLPSLAQTAGASPPSSTDLLPDALCLCDLTRNSCDINCCCDSTCSAEEQARFTTCLPSASSAPELNYCISEDSVAKVCPRHCLTSWSLALLCSDDFLPAHVQAPAVTPGTISIAIVAHALVHCNSQPQNTERSAVWCAVRLQQQMLHQ
jgi:Protein of unknown function (DUF1619)